MYMINDIHGKNIFAVKKGTRATSNLKGLISGAAKIDCYANNNE